jgi:hypothetical protein
MLFLFTLTHILGLERSYPEHTHPFFLLENQMTALSLFSVAENNQRNAYEKFNS